MVLKLVAAVSCALRPVAPCQTVWTIRVLMAPDAHHTNHWYRVQVEAPIPVLQYYLGPNLGLKVTTREFTTCAQRKHNLWKSQKFTVLPTHDMAKTHRNATEMFYQECVGNGEMVILRKKMKKEVIGLGLKEYSARVDSGVVLNSY
ncbi:hypothetical protein K438DRAFT_1758002 [Mycena galopus ATCC 62051]|nr:hypothetical protein K438DRAFT_1758002 [Mycena galopus ATCC 62051]